MSPSEGNKRGDYSRYDQMSTAELEQLLRLDFQASEGGDSDLDTILYISDLLAKRSGPADTGAAWEQFQTKYRPCAHGRSLYDLDEEDGQAPEAEQRPAAPVPPRPRRARHLRRLAVLAAVLAACLLWGIMAAQAAGVDVLKAIAQWTDETFRFVSTASGTSASSSTGGEEPEQPQSTLQALGMDGMFPAWHPDGYTPGSLEVTELNISVSAHMTFFGEDRSYLVVVQHYTQPQDETGTFEKDDTPVEEYVHNGQVFYILSNLDSLTATTFDGEFLTMICGVLTREEIKSIIDSIPNQLAASEQEQLQTLLGEEAVPPQIPEGFVSVQSNFYIDPINNDIYWSKLYTRGEQNLVWGLTKYTSPSNTIYEKDDTPVEEYVYHGVTHYLFSNNGTTTAAWMAGNTEHYMLATDGAVDLKALIRSVYEAG